MKHNPTPVFKRILYATNLGDKMRPVFRHAVHQARLHDAKIVMFHAVAPIGTTGQTVLSLYLEADQIKHLEDESLDQVIAVMKARLDNYCAKEEDICSDQDKLVSDTVVISGNPGEMIVQYAENNAIDLIVMGSHARASGTLEGIGSSARYVTLHSKVPVLVIPNN